MSQNKTSTLCTWFSKTDQTGKLLCKMPGEVSWKVWKNAQRREKIKQKSKLINLHLHFRFLLFSLLISISLLVWCIGLFGSVSRWLLELAWWDFRIICRKRNELIMIHSGQKVVILLFPEDTPVPTIPPFLEIFDPPMMLVSALYIQR